MFIVVRQYSDVRDAEVRLVTEVSEIGFHLSPWRLIDHFAAKLYQGTKGTIGRYNRLHGVHFCEDSFSSSKWEWRGRFANVCKLFFMAI